MQLGKLKGELSGLTWSPDGRRSGPAGGPKTDAETNREERREDGIVVGRDLKRTRLWVVDAVTGAARQLTFGDQHVRDATGRATGSVSPS
jgi:hypothetical protein